MGQMAFEVRVVTGEEIGEELKRALRARDLEDVRIAGLAARFAATRADRKSVV